MSRHFQALARIGLAVVGTLAVPSIASAQYNRVPDPNATRVLVAVFKAGEKGLGVQAADAVRSRMNSEFPFKQVYVLPKTDINATLEASGFPITDALEAHDQRALATLLRADEYVTVYALGQRVVVAVAMCPRVPSGCIDAARITADSVSVAGSVKGWNGPPFRET